MDWIIVVDDSPTCLKVVVQLLKKAEKKVTPFISAEDFLSFYDKKVKENHIPDAIMMDVAMPEINGFEAVERLRKLEEEKKLPNIPVVFITAEEGQEIEKECFKVGAADYIKKPLDADILNIRLDNIITTQRKIKEAEEQALTDHMTGLLNKQATDEQITELCHTQAGSLMVMDIDSFKLVNDIYGHDIGDQVLKLFTELISKNMIFKNITGRIGGDEFLVFGIGMTNEADIQRFTDNINKEFADEAKKIFNENVNIPLGVSIGAVLVPEMGTDYNELFHLADQALYSVKNNGKHGYAICHEENKDNCRIMNLKTITSILNERNAAKNAVWMGEDAFIGIYRYMIRYMKRYHRIAYRVLLSLDFTNNPDSKDKEASIEEIRRIIQKTLRNSDIMMQTGDNQFFLLLPEVDDKNIETVMSRMIKALNEEKNKNNVAITYETGSINFTEEN